MTTYPSSEVELGRCHVKISQQVENILKASQSARDSDKTLYIIYMQKSDMNLSAEQIETFLQMPSLETVRRTRQLLQEQGKYPASPKVEEARYNKFRATKDGIHDEDPETLLEKQGYKVLPW